MEGDDYAAAFAPSPHRCYRYVCADDAGRPGPCPGAIRWRGVYRDAAGKVWKVVACDRHAMAISDPHPMEFDRPAAP